MDKVEAFLKENERIDDLQYRGMKIIQDETGFKFGIDAVLLANFARVKPNSRVADLGTGTGIIPILLAAKTEAKIIYGLEIQHKIAEMAARSVLLNSLSERVRIIEGDIRESDLYFKPSSIDTVVTNPPYMNRGGGLVNPSDEKAIARHELACTLEDVVRAAARMLVTGGTYFMVHRPERLADIITTMRNYKIEPKRMRFVYPDISKKPCLILVEGLKNGNPYINVDKPLYVYNTDGSYSDEINRIYCRGEYSVGGNDEPKGADV